MIKDIVEQVGKAVDHFAPQLRVVVQQQARGLWARFIRKSPHKVLLRLPEPKDPPAWFNDLRALYVSEQWEAVATLGPHLLTHDSEDDIAVIRASIFIAIAKIRMCNMVCAKQYLDAAAQNCSTVDDSEERRELESVVFLNRSLVFLRLGDIAKAKSDIEKSLRLNPSEFMALYNALCVWSQDEDDKACQVVARRLIKGHKDKIIHYAKNFKEDPDLEFFRMSKFYSQEFASILRGSTTPKKNARNKIAKAAGFALLLSVLLGLGENSRTFGAGAGTAGRSLTASASKFGPRSAARRRLDVLASAGTAGRTRTSNPSDVGSYPQIFPLLLAEAGTAGSSKSFGGREFRLGLNRLLGLDFWREEEPQGALGISTPTGRV